MSLRFLPDANIYIHALNVRSLEHVPCRKWLDQATAANHVLLVNDLTECALLRIGTLPNLGFSTVPVVLKFWAQLLSYPGTERVVPGSEHHSICARFMNKHRLVGNDVNDVWLAALAMEHRATLVSTDEGFARFPGLDWVKPLHPKEGF